MSLYWLAAREESYDFNTADGIKRGIRKHCHSMCYMFHTDRALLGASETASILEDWRPRRFSRVRHCVVGKCHRRCMHSQKLTSPVLCDWRFSEAHMQAPASILHLQLSAAFPFLILSKNTTFDHHTAIRQLPFYNNYYSAASPLSTTEPDSKQPPWQTSTQTKPSASRS